jgi:ubiquinone/menaquinone biosynthesis C-methylase UbiE
VRSFNAAVAVLVLFLNAPIQAQTGQTEGINDNYKSRALDVKEWVGRFEVEGREAFDLRHEIVAAMELQPGQSIADVGAGTGLFEPLFASAVGTKGKVYALDIAPKFIEYIRSRAQQAGLTQVAAVLGTERSIELPEHSVDVVFASDAYHHFVHYQDMLASIRKALRPGGRLFIVDFDIEAKDTNRSMIQHVGKKKSEFSEQITAAGFKFDRDLTLPKMKTNFFYRFVKE